MADNSAFISYRRETGYPWARLVWDGLRDRSVDAFFDLESLRAAGRFDDRLLNQIAARPYFVPILTTGTLERCAEPADWLRREIEHAIATRRVIVPLFIAPFGPSDFPSTVPDHIDQALGESNGLTIYSQYLEPALDQLVNDRLQPIEIASLPLTADDAEFQHEVEEHVQSLPPPTVPVTPVAANEVTIRPVDSEPVVLGGGAAVEPDAPTATVPLATMPPPSPAPAPGDGSRNRRIAIVLGAAAAVIALFVVIGIVAGDGGDDDPPIATGADTTLADQQPPTTPTEPRVETTPAPPAECDGVLSIACTSEGDTRDDVRELQVLLNRTEFGPGGGLAEDGQFGPNTNAALVAFERRCSTCTDDAQIEIDRDEWAVLEEWAAVGLRSADRVGVDALAENWVLQLAAYGTCLFPDNPFDPGAVRGLHDAFDVQVAGLGGAVLASGDELNLHNDGGSRCYFSFLNRPFADRDDARQFCTDELDDECFPKFVSDDPSVSVADGP